jgi:ABC-type transport system involved in multi-copper enzyme maturation permease subunit
VPEQEFGHEIEDASEGETTTMATAQETMPPASPAVRPSLPRAWWALVLLSLRRQARARQMVWIALGLLAFAAAMTAVGTATDAWHTPRLRRWLRYNEALFDAANFPSDPSYLGSPVHAVGDAIFMAARLATTLDDYAFLTFARQVILSVFLSFLLPMWCLSFATEALGGEREGGSLIWLLARPLPRWSIYLAKFVALLPWAVGFCLGGFAVLCLAGGRPGLTALRLFWPAVLCATLAFAALFHLMAACSRRPAIVAVAYSFVLEVLLGNMPGYLKRVSIGFYARCMMYEAAESLGLQTEKPGVYLPVDGATATAVLLTATAAFLVAGMIVFSRAQYSDGA